MSLLTPVFVLLFHAHAFMLFFLHELKTTLSWSSDLNIFWDETGKKNLYTEVEKECHEDVK